MTFYEMADRIQIKLLETKERIALQEEPEKIQALCLLYMNELRALWKQISYRHEELNSVGWRDNEQKLHAATKKIKKEIKRLVFLEDQVLSVDVKFRHIFIQVEKEAEKIDPDWKKDELPTSLLETKNVQDTLKYFEGKCIKKSERGNWIITKTLANVIIDFQYAILAKKINFPSKDEEIKDFILCYLKTKKGNSLRESYDKYEERKTQKPTNPTKGDKRRKN
ncbi:hypothetical protein FACS1894130_10560 [Spirochaetia bacterium]|nr:hypothetical protein FACS1894130_10560 [Spirochaetia bacterium]